MDSYQNRGKFDDLANRLEDSDPRKYHKIIGRARAGEYDDFANQLVAAPKMQMVEDLREVGLEDDAKQVINGDYDQ